MPIPSRVLSPFRAICTALLLAVMSVTNPGVARAQDLTVLAAASLRGALDEVATLWAEDTGGRLTLVYAGSSALARQITLGAPGDVFVAANVAWMDAVGQAGQVAPDSRIALLTNSLVVIAGADDATPLDLDAPGALAERLGPGRLALAMTGAVPAGIYARQSLQALGHWDAVATQVVEADNVRAALALVATGAAPVGIVYATDALAEPRVSVIARLPADSHEPIVYPAAALAGGDLMNARSFLAFLEGEAAQAAFLRHGFGLPGAG